MHATSGLEQVEKRGWDTKISTLIGADIHIYLIYKLGRTEIQAVKKCMEVDSIMIHVQL